MMKSGVCVRALPIPAKGQARNLAQSLAQNPANDLGKLTHEPIMRAADVQNKFLASPGLYLYGQRCTFF